MRAIFLVDNGSLRAAAVFNLRRLATLLSERLGEEVQAASLLHANKIPSEELDGVAAATLGPAAERSAEAGAQEIIVVPLFFGASRALTAYLPERLGALQARFPQVAVTVAMPLIDEYGDNDLRLAELLADNVRAALPSERCGVILVDHGSPIPEVTAVRNRVAGQLSALLGDQARFVVAASMERREGEAYRFNEPLLETLLATPEIDGPVVLAMLFLSPGRHAGPGGDIAHICQAAMVKREALRVLPTRLVGEHPDIVALLHTRAKQALAHQRFLLQMPAGEAAK